jgi:hypothetical protein
MESSTGSRRHNKNGIRRRTMKYRRKKNNNTLGTGSSSKPPALKTKPLTPSPEREEGSHSYMYTNQFVPFMEEHYPEETTGFIYNEPYYVEDEPTKTTIKIYKKDIDECAAMSIYYEENEEIEEGYNVKEIVLDELSKCGEHTGTQVLELIEHFAKEYNYEKISLIDASNIVSNDPANCRIPLRFFMILATGQTWYNSKGYKSPYFKKEYKHNVKIIETPLLTYFRGIMPEEQYEDIKERLISLNKRKRFKILKKPIDETITVKEFFSTIKQELGRSALNCDENPLHKWLNDVLHIIALSGARIHSSKIKNIKNLPKNNIVFVWDISLSKEIT